MCVYKSVLRAIKLNNRKSPEREQLVDKLLYAWRIVVGIDDCHVPPRNVSASVDPPPRGRFRNRAEPRRSRYKPADHRGNNDDRAWWNGPGGRSARPIHQAVLQAYKRTTLTRVLSPPLSLLPPSPPLFPLANAKLIAAITGYARARSP